MHARGRCGSGEDAEDAGADATAAEAAAADEEVDKDEESILPDAILTTAVAAVAAVFTADEAAAVADSGARTQNTASPSSPNRFITASTSGAGFGQ